MIMGDFVLIMGYLGVKWPIILRNLAFQTRPGGLGSALEDLRSSECHERRSWCRVSLSRASPPDDRMDLGPVFSYDPRVVRWAPSMGP